MANIIRNNPKVHLIIPDSHAHPKFNNNRADYLGKLIMDIKPDVVVNMGDMWDMSSMASYDKGTKSFQGRTFKKDLEAGLDFDERIWSPLRKAKKRRPRSVFLEGNHEFRLKRAIEVQPELDGMVSFEDFNLKRNYSDIVEYQGTLPGIIEIDGITYCHYAVSGVSGRPVSSEHIGYALLTKKLQSTTVGHTHVFSYSNRPNAQGKVYHGLCAGVYQDYESEWSGVVNNVWARGLVVKREVQNGNYDLQWISLPSLAKEYAK